ncbi:MAG: hypothetical protein WDW36_001503 [Sanguina aurantia]
MSSPTALKFSDVIDLEPLLRACMSALSQAGGKRGAGYKVLRLVSKQVNQLAATAVTGCTFIINGRAGRVPDMSEMLPAQLSRLRVTVKAGQAPSNHVGPRHVAQMQRFLAAAGPALRSITTLQISIHQFTDDEFASNASVEQIAAVLGPLAEACPLVHTLRLVGDLGSPLLSTLGASFRNLTSLHTVAMPAETLQQLPALFPRATSTRVEIFSEHSDTPDKPEYHEDEVAACPTMTCLDVNSHALVESTWRCLPEGLQQLRFGSYCACDMHTGHPSHRGNAWEEFGSTIPAELQAPELTEVHYRSDRMPLCLLAALLRAAPKLRSVSVSDVGVPCSLDQIPDLVFVHERLAKGLQVEAATQKRRRSGTRAPSLMLHFQDAAIVVPEGEEGTDGDDYGGFEGPPARDGSASPAFFAALPVFERFTRVALAVLEQPSIAHLARAFPRMLTLGVHRGSAWFSGSSICSLTLLSALQILDLVHLQSKLSLFELGYLCLAIPSLRQLNVDDSCATYAEELSVKEGLQAVGSKIVFNGR